MKGRVVKVGAPDCRLAEAVVQRLREAHPGISFRIVPFRTQGGRFGSLAALLRRRISMAVHSMEDLPPALPEGPAIGAVIERGDPSDAFISRDGTPLEKLPDRARIGTSCPRVRSLLKSLHPGFVFADSSGDLTERLEKLRGARSRLAGIVASAAGVLRLRSGNGFHVQVLPRHRVVPAAGQGATGVVIRGDDREAMRILAPVHHVPTAACVEAERELLRRLGDGGRVPLGVLAEPAGDGLLHVTAVLAAPDGAGMLRESQIGVVEDPRSVAEALETILRNRGTRELPERTGSRR